MTDKKDKYIDINIVAKLKGYTTNRPVRQEINKENSRYTARKVKVQGGFSYEILFSTLEPEIQEKILDEEIKSKSLVPININNNIEPVYEFKTEKLRVETLAKIDIIKSFERFESRYSSKKQAEEIFLDLYNSGEYLKDIYKQIGKISRSSLYRWSTTYKKYGTVECLIPNYKCSALGEYNTSLTPEMIEQFEKFLFHPNRFKIAKAISLSKYCLEQKGFENLPADIAFRRYADHIKKVKYDKWILFREGEKAFNDKVMPYIERDPNLLDVGDVLVADGHDLNFQVINPFTGNPTRATLVGFFDWKSNALVGYEIMMSESTQCIASALRSSIINLGKIPKVVYQDNGRAFKSKYFQIKNLDEAGFNGVYANLGIESVFAKVRNAQAKVIERFFLEFQEELEKMIPSYIGTSIEDKPARLRRGENLHKAHYLKTTGGIIPTVEQVIKCIDFWLYNYHFNKPNPHDPNMTIKESLKTVKKEHIDISKLNYLMMKTEAKTIHRNGIRFLNQNYYSDSLFGLKEQVYIRYSLFDLTKVLVYSLKGEFICTAKRVEKVHPMARVLGTVKDMEDVKQKIKKKTRLKNKAVKEFKKYFDIETTGILEITPETKQQIEEYKPEKPKREKKKTPREQQMNRPYFKDNFEKYEWLLKNGCTCQEDRQFIKAFKQTDEYNLIYGGTNE